MELPCSVSFKSFVFDLCNSDHGWTLAFCFIVLQLLNGFILWFLHSRMLYYVPEISMKLVKSACLVSGTDTI